MGKKKKFVDKKKDATFRLVYRDFSYGSVGEDDRVFTRLDGGNNFVPGFSEDDHLCSVGVGEARDSIFADAEDDGSRLDELEPSRFGQVQSTQQQKMGLPEHVRRELIELGFPDDGYNYLKHLREIGPSGNFFSGNNDRPHLLRTDTKAYDASRVQICYVPEEEADCNDTLHVDMGVPQIRGFAYTQRTFDPDVIALLEKTDGSVFDSADELDDDFVIKANDQTEGKGFQACVQDVQSADDVNFLSLENQVEESEKTTVNNCETVAGIYEAARRPTRLLDEQFELLTMREYNDEDDSPTHGHIPVSEFNNVLSDFLMRSSLSVDKYQTPADLQGELNPNKTLSYLDKHDDLKGEVGSVADPSSGKDDSFLFVDKPLVNLVEDNLPSPSSEVQEEEEMVLLEDDSGDGHEIWDCETIVSTFSNLDNHPAKICTLSGYHSKKMAAIDAKQSKVDNPVIQLRGKNQLPVEFLHKGGSCDRSGDHKIVKSRVGHQEVKAVDSRKAGETKEEKKCRKALVKEERRDARRAKKLLKKMYRAESQQAHRDATFVGPSVIHL
eukprot:c28627_g1_i2 orf=310-1971(-)